MTTDLAEKPQELVLTPDQEAAMLAIYQFLADPAQTVFVLSGYSGCGKSTLVHTLLDRLDTYQKTLQLINPSYRPLEVQLTATTNKAAENLMQITGHSVTTIHSALSLRVQTDFRTNTTKLIPRAKEPLRFKLLGIDEASYIDSDLLQHIFDGTEHCKILFIGDPAQLTPVKSSGTPVFDANFQGAALTQVVRQAEGNPIVQLSTLFRHTVNTGEWTAFKPDGHHIQHMGRDAFDKAIEAEFTRPNWRYRDSKILGWTNKCVIGYNGFVRNLAKGDPDFQEGDYAVCNSYLQVGKMSVKTDQMVQITEISEDIERCGVMGNNITMDHVITAFQPKSREAAKARVKSARAQGDLHTVQTIEGSWVDLRAAYACTINKSQGSTFDKVFIDLDDIARCTNGNLIARMLYVGVSRARHQVFLTGDLA